MAPPPSKPLKILMLHGFTQSGPLFRAKTRALEKNLQKAFGPSCTLHYPTAPIRLPPSDLTFGPTSSTSTSTDDEPPDAWGWWRRTGDAEPFVYEGLEAGMARVAQTLRDSGPFDGVVGFSQGGAAAALVAALLEEGRREVFAAAEAKGGMRYPEAFEGGEEEGGRRGLVHPPLKFAVSYSGFRTTENALYQAFYEPKIRTPMLHFLGSLDTVVEEKRSLRLVAECEKSEGRVVYHPGGHFLPSSQKAYVSALINFIKEVMSGADGDTKEEKAEDMDVPF